MRTGNNAECGTYARGCQTASVAVGQQTAAGLHQRTARTRDGVAELFILINQTQRFRRQRRHKIFLPQRPLHAVEVVHQINRRRPGGAQRFQRQRQFITTFAVFGQQRQQQACRETDQRRAAHPQGVNMPHQRLYR